MNDLYTTHIQKDALDLIVSIVEEHKGIKNTDLVLRLIQRATPAMLLRDEFGPDLIQEAVKIGLILSIEYSVPGNTTNLSLLLPLGSMLL